MSHKDNADLRNTGDGGWFYAEHELFSVFVPLIGPDGGMVYMALCRLIPLAQVDPDRPVTVRSLSDASCVSRSTVHRKLAMIVTLGMVEETRHAKGRPSTYKLMSLRKLAMVGHEALERLLSVPPGDTSAEEEKSEPMPQGGEDAAQEPSVGRDASESGPSEAPSLPTVSGASGEDGVPQWDTDASATLQTLAELPVSQKQASVSQKGGVGVPKTGLGVPKRGSLFKEEEEEEEEYLTPLPPSSARGDVPDLFASASTSPNEWVRVLAQLETKINRQSFETWLKPTRFSHIAGKTLFVRIPSVDFGHVGKRFADQIQEAIDHLGLDFDTVSFVAPPPEATPAGVQASAEAGPMPRPSRPEPLGLDLDPALTVAGAAQVVAHESGVSDPRVIKAFEGAVRLEVQNGKTPAEIAEWMVRQRREFVATPGTLAFGVSKFFLQGIWRDSRLWGVDEKFQRRRSNARIGSRGP